MGRWRGLPLGSLLPAEELVVDFLDAAEFGDGLRVIVDAEVDVAVVCAAVAPAIADDEECGGLACGEGVDEWDDYAESADFGIAINLHTSRIF